MGFAPPCGGCRGGIQTHPRGTPSSRVMGADSQEQVLQFSHNEEEQEEPL